MKPYEFHDDNIDQVINNGKLFHDCIVLIKLCIFDLIHDHKVIDELGECGFARFYLV